MFDSTMMNESIQKGALVATVTCQSLDSESIERFARECAELAHRYTELPLVLDITALKFLASVAIGGIIRLANQCKGNGRRLVLAGLDEKIHNMLKKTCTDRMFEIRGSVAEALRDAGDGSSSPRWLV